MIENATDKNDIDLRVNPANPKQRGNYSLTNFVSNYDDLNFNFIL